MIESPLLQIPDSSNGLPVHNPATGEILARVPTSDAQQVELAIERAAITMRKKSTPAERAQWLSTIAAKLLDNRDELARIITLEQGKPIKESCAEVEYSAGFFSFFAGQAVQLEPRVLPEKIRDAQWTVHHRAAGVAALITPWNFPLAMLAKKLAPALLAGCGAIIKPAEETPLSALALCEIARQCGVPDDWIQCVVGDPKIIGGVLCRHEAIRVLSFTGSTAVGKILLKQTAPHIKRVALELGGNAPFIIFEDADIEAAADHLMANKFRCAGQTCVCANRVYVYESIAEQFTDAVIERARKLRVGDGLDEDTDIGPLINRDGWRKVARHVQDALQNGARRVLGEDCPEPENDWGYYFLPTVLTDCHDEMLAFHEETFGPVIAISTFADTDGVLYRANSTEYGLAAYVFTKDKGRGEYCARELKFGHVAINTGSGPTPQAPFGGMKFSGLGREGGEEGLMEYVEIQTVVSSVIGTI